jgi:glycine/D-amino acid oxidase-like deaminating enzyme
MAPTYDIIVIGGGVIGASVLFHLTQLGCRNVLLLERGPLAGGATSRSSGIVRTHYSVPINVQVARASLAIFENFSAVLDDPDADAGLVRSGYLIVAPPGAPSEAVRASIAMQRQLGVEAELLDRGQALSRHPWLALDDIDAIGFEAEAGFADPYLVTTGFARAARRNGAAVSTETEVTGLLRDGSRIIGVQTKSGPIHAGTVLSAVNVWSRSVAGWAGIEIPFEITAHHVFTLAADAPYTPDLPVVKDLASPSRLYTRPSGGHLLVGAGHEGCSTDDPKAGWCDPGPGCTTPRRTGTRCWVRCPGWTALPSRSAFPATASSCRR